ncbi:MAG: Activator of Hsp90 ATPase 1 family protein [Myxococcaceae bacterium]|nr:Activator of Hsp90 ATPase 1 family protein [Myxococcaceae bacterium]
MQTSNENRSKLDRATSTITFERTLAASREQVFDAWTKPERVAQWWDPTGTPLVECTIDLRAGGAFRFVNDGHSPPFAGVYTIIERPAKLVFDALGAVGTVLVESRGTTTHLTVTIRCASAEHLEQFVKMGIDVGTNQTLDNLVAYVQKASN